MKQLKTAFVNIFLTFSILFVLYLTLIPHDVIHTGNVAEPPARHFTINLNPLMIFKNFQSDSLFYFIVDDLGNMMLFLPFGFFLTMKYPHFHWAHTLFIGALFSATIEWIQLFMPNRMTDIDDVILNTTGAVLGYMLYRFVQTDDPIERS
ncbi:VanZ family protein [Sporolactobacillus shoreicorticis]|uniref:VanZ family protein n=1 Tax=Sporolactobacillus shoreicorticis TaxID=1923877 RepID=A0ABW5S370_9BACL|nr:VanZ family protein [Sporolactobacillus shoreicorticis]MCO7124288.1 VanZ family protein [Sporolactobacillus shoreicorticis]